MITLLPEELSFLKTLLNREQTDYWVKDHLLDKLNYQEMEWMKMKKCNHTPGTYLGKKTVCSLCGSHYLPGMGFEWSLQTQ